jgi:hypothetical protein
LEAVRRDMGKSERVAGQKYSVIAGGSAETQLMFSYGSSLFYPIFFNVVGLPHVCNFIHQF